MKRLSFISAIFATAMDYFQSPAIRRREKIITVTVLALYIIMPFDALPDWLSVIGWLDDAGMCCLTLAWFRHRLNKTAQKPAAHDKTT